MKHRGFLLIGAGLIMLTVSSCGMMAKMMGMGDLMGAMNNMDKVMAMSPDQMKGHAAAKVSAAYERGKVLFNDPATGGSKNEISCNSCHPGGGSTGGEAEIKKKMGHGPYRLPIPSLVGAAAHFPKYKIPNNEVISLAQMDNNCIRMFMGGKRLPLNSPESFYLAAYVSSLSNGEEIEVAKDANAASK